MTDESLLQAYVDAYFSTFKSINELISAPMANTILVLNNFGFYLILPMIPILA